MLRLTRLRLTDFRNYRQLSWDHVPRLAVISGQNGSGKTNLLEAVSLLAPGRGLRNATTAEVLRNGAGRWGVAARLNSAAGPVEIGTGSGDKPDRRVFRLNEENPRSQAEIAAHISLVWLTPQMDVLFQEPASGRRRFLDRLVHALEPAHVRQIAAHDTAQSQRARLLAAGNADPAWLAGLEDSIARHAVAATAARQLLVGRLNQALGDGAAAGFPQARMSLVCPIADRLQSGSALVAEDWLRGALHGARATDARTGSAAFGAQRADMTLADATTGASASSSSTGQRKAMLIGVVLGHAALIGALRGVAPILLLDEPMVHLDFERRALLCEAARRIQAQFMLTGTDPDAFGALADAAGFFHIENGTLHRSHAL